MSRKLNEELLPQSPSYPPIPSDYPSNESFTQAFDEWETNSNKILEENRERFEKALKVSTQCNFIKAFFFMPIDWHFKWCPAPYWYNPNELDERQ